MHTWSRKRARRRSTSILFIVMMIQRTTLSFQPRQKAILLVSTSSIRRLSTTHREMSCQPLEGIQSVAAPMVAASDYAFRCLCRSHGVQLCYTQMIHAKHLVNNPTFYKNHWDLYEYGQQQGVPDVLTMAQQNLYGDTDRLNMPPNKNDIKDSTSGPLVVQLAGHDVSIVLRAAELVVSNTQQQVMGIDLNLGCPQGIARKGRYGAFLIEETPDLVYDILTKLRSRLPHEIAVSAKIRLPLDPSVQTDRIQRLCETGIDFLTVHGRDLTENKTKTGGIHLDRMIAAVQQASLYNVPVIANGGVEEHSDIKKLLEATGATAVMSSEALLERPSIFAQATPTAPELRFREQIQFARDYLEWCRYAPPLPGVQGYSFNTVRGHLFKFLYRYLQEHSDLRDILADYHTKFLHQAYKVVDTLEDRYQTVDWEDLESSQYPDSTWYRRHRNEVNQKQLSVPEKLLTVDERKAQMRGRIAKLRQQNRATLMQQ